MKDCTDRLVRDGWVAVLYSPGYGAGWSTWQPDPDVRISMLFDPQIADLVQRSPDWQAKVEAMARIKYPDAYLGGLQHLKVKWLRQGTQFYIDERDGSESIVINGEQEWITA